MALTRKSYKRNGAGKEVVMVRKSHKGRGERKVDAQGRKENGGAGKIIEQTRISFML